jgi:5-oxoprolinase (ATP-hydrolysing) subunit A
VMCASAAELGVAIGAHVSYPDLIGFGRRHMDLSHDELADGVLYQIAALEGFARLAGARVAYVKPHGALANTIVHDPVQAAAVVAAVTAFSGDVALMGFPNSQSLSQAATAGLRTLTEGFPDRGYNPDGSLVSRKVSGAVIEEPDEVTARALLMATQQQVVAIDGSLLQMRFDSLCVHGDNPAAVKIAQQIRATFSAAGIAVTSPRR